jgi:polar amino acid transport system substrate-binding protein
MKKLFTLILMLLVAASFTGCGGDGGNATTNENQTSATTKIGVLEYLNTDEQQFTGYVKKIVGNYSIVVPNPQEFKFFSNLASMQMALEAGQIDEMGISSPVARYMVDRNPKMQILEDYMTTGTNNYTKDGKALEFANDFCLAFTSQNTALKIAADSVIADMIKDGTLTKLTETYITNLKANEEPQAVEFENIEGADTITVAVTGDLPPFDYISTDGKAAGFNTAFLAELGKRLNKNVKTIGIESGARAAALTSGQADVAFWMVVPVSQVIPANADKPDGVELSAPYYRSSIVHVALKK